MAGACVSSGGTAPDPTAAATMATPTLRDMRASSRADAGSSDRAPIDPITRWLWMVGAIVVVMILVGGFVRLSQAGLSIVEWDPIGGAVPPVGDAAWQESFAAYQQTPEYQLVNQGMSLEDFQRIFMIEWAHRLIARLAGLFVVVPILLFIRRGLVTWRQSVRYWGVAALFGVQGYLGWVMVSSGLRDRPVVSDFRLTIHLLAALVLLGMVMLMAFDRMRARGTLPIPVLTQGPQRSDALTRLLMGAVILQIAYGGLVAGLKAGYVSNTWPLMFGKLIPTGLLSQSEPWFRNLIEPTGAHWVHRWLAFLVAGIALAVLVRVRHGYAAGGILRPTAIWLVGVVSLQIALGVGVVIFGVPKWLALAHQGIGVAVFSLAVTITYLTQPRPAERV